jgi:hypothetical protein
VVAGKLAKRNAIQPAVEKPDGIVTHFTPQVCPESSACGLSDNRLYLSFLRRKDVWAWRDET